MDAEHSTAAAARLFTASPARNIVVAWPQSPPPTTTGAAARVVLSPSRRQDAAAAAAAAADASAVTLTEVSGPVIVTNPAMPHPDWPRLCAQLEAVHEQFRDGALDAQTYHQQLGDLMMALHPAHPTDAPSNLVPSASQLVPCLTGEVPLLFTPTSQQGTSVAAAARSTPTSARAAASATATPPTTDAPAATASIKLLDESSSNTRTAGAAVPPATTRSSPVVASPTNEGAGDPPGAAAASPAGTPGITAPMAGLTSHLTVSRTEEENSTQMLQQQSAATTALSGSFGCYSSATAGHLLWALRSLRESAGVEEAADQLPALVLLLLPELRARAVAMTSSTRYERGTRKFDALIASLAGAVARNALKSNWDLPEALTAALEDLKNSPEQDPCPTVVEALNTVCDKLTCAQQADLLNCIFRKLNLKLSGRRGDEMDVFELLLEALCPAARDEAKLLSRLATLQQQQQQGQDEAATPTGTVTPQGVAAIDSPRSAAVRAAPAGALHFRHLQTLERYSGPALFAACLAGDQDRRKFCVRVCESPLARIPQFACVSIVDSGVRGHQDSSTAALAVTLSLHDDTTNGTTSVITDQHTLTHVSRARLRDPTDPTRQLNVDTLISEQAALGAGGQPVHAAAVATYRVDDEGMVNVFSLATNDKQPPALESLPDRSAASAQPEQPPPEQQQQAGNSYDRLELEAGGLVLTGSNAKPELQPSENRLSSNDEEEEEEEPHVLPPVTPPHHVASEAPPDFTLNSSRSATLQPALQQGSLSSPGRNVSDSLRRRGMLDSPSRNGTEQFETTQRRSRVVGAPTPTVGTTRRAERRMSGEFSARGKQRTDPGSASPMFVRGTASSAAAAIPPRSIRARTAAMPPVVAKTPSKEDARRNYTRPAAVGRRTGQLDAVGSMPQTAHRVPSARGSKVLSQTTLPRITSGSYQSQTTAGPYSARRLNGA